MPLFIKASIFIDTFIYNGAFIYKDTPIYSLHINLIKSVGMGKLEDQIPQQELFHCHGRSSAGPKISHIQWENTQLISRLFLHDING